MQNAAERRLADRLAVAVIAFLVLLAAAVAAIARQPAPGAQQLAHVRLGVGAPLTGPRSFEASGIVDAVRMAINDNKDTLSAVGIEMDDFTVDDSGTPAGGRKAAALIAADGGVVGVVGHVGSDVSIAASGAYVAAGVVQVSPASTAMAYTAHGGRTTFRVCPDDIAIGVFAADEARGRIRAPAGFPTLGRATVGPFRSAALVAETESDEPAASAFGLRFLAPVASGRPGGRVVLREVVSPSTAPASDGTSVAALRTLAERIRDSGADVVFYSGGLQTGAFLTRALRDAGVTAPLLGGEALHDPRWPALAGPAAKAAWCVSIARPPDTIEQGKDFATKLAKLGSAATGQDYGAYAYDAASAIIDAVIVTAKQRGTAVVATPEGRRDIAAILARTDRPGLTGTVRFDSKGNRIGGELTLWRSLAGEDAVGGSGWSLVR